MSSLLEKIKSNKKIAIIGGVGILALILVITLAIVVFSTSYNLSSSIKSSMSVIPGEVSSYCEVKNPQELKDIITKSDFGKEISSSQAWTNLLTTPESKSLFNMIYYLELKAGLLFDIKDIPSFLGGSIGAAKMQDGSMLIVARTNLKSKLAAGLFTALNGEKVSVAKKKKKAPKKVEKAPANPGEANVVSAKNYQTLYQEEEVKLSNIRVSKIKIRNDNLYMVMLNDFLFISDKLETMKASLALATNPKKASLKNKAGMENAFNDLGEDGQILLYINPGKTAAAPMFKGFIEGEGAALVLSIGETLSGNIYTINSKKKKEEKNNQTDKNSEEIAWEKNLPNGSVLTLYSKKLGVSNLLESINSLGKNWKAMKSGVSGFLKSSKIDPKTYFGNKQGLALVFHSMEIKTNNIYPRFSLGYSAQKNDKKVLTAIFKTGGASKKTHQGVSYTTHKKGYRYYSPSYILDKNVNYVSSNEDLAKEIISAKTGNRPILKDLKSYKELKDMEEAPHHLLIDIPLLIQAIKEFNYYGAKRTTQYSSKTIDRDVMPLFDPFKKYKTIHISMGMQGDVNGKLVLTNK
ncbi:MAG: hypothetical protein GY754_10980 [bacterium]|nr:hypothetical protein [bacterium]